MYYYVEEPQIDVNGWEGLCMNSDTISHIVKGLKNKYKEYDPFELCKSLNIIIGIYFLWQKENDHH